MPRLVDANRTCRVIEQLFCGNCHDDCENCPYNDVLKLLRNQSTVDAEPVKHGYWCFEEFPDGYYHWECSECEKWFGEDSMSIDEEWNYCPNCGAKMDKVE